MFCNHCGNKIPDNAKFCNKCGSKVEARLIISPSAPSPAPAAQNPANSAPQRPVWQQNQPSAVQNPANSAPQRPAWQPNQAPISPAPVPPPAAPVSRPVREPVPEQKPKKEKPLLDLPAKPSGGKRFVAVLLCIFIFLFGLLASLLGSLRWAYSENGVRNLVENAELKDMTLPPDDKSLSAAIMEGSGLGGVEGFDYEYGINEDELGEILDEDFVKDEISDRLAGFSRYLCMMDEFPTIDLEEIAETIEKPRNMDVIRKHARADGNPFVEAEETELTFVDRVFNVNELKQKYDLPGGKRITELVVRDQIQESVGFDALSLLVPVTSLWGFLILCGVVLALLALLFILLRHYLRSAFTRSGVTFIILGLLVALLGGGLYVLMNLTPLFTANVFATVTNPLSFRAMIVGGGILALGLVFVLALRPLCKKRPDALPGEQPAA